MVGPEIVGKRLALLKEAIPKLSRVAVLRNPTNPDLRVFIRETAVATRSLKVQLHVVDAPGPAEFEGAFAAMTQEHASALLPAGRTPSARSLIVSPGAAHDATRIAW